MEDNDDRNDNGYRLDKIWLVKQIVLVILGGFYLYFGIHLLISSYQMNNPLTFMLTFFASNLIILISAALLVGFIYRIIVVYRYIKRKDTA
jgi:ABC-type antimicrobial peptide transport system permease subunit